MRIWLLQPRRWVSKAAGAVPSMWTRGRLHHAARRRKPVRLCVHGRLRRQRLHKVPARRIQVRPVGAAICQGSSSMWAGAANSLRPACGLAAARLPSVIASVLAAQWAAACGQPALSVPTPWQARPRLAPLLSWIVAAAFLVTVAAPAAFAGQAHSVQVRMEEQWQPCACSAVSAGKHPYPRHAASFGRRRHACSMPAVSWCHDDQPAGGSQRGILPVFGGLWCRRRQQRLHTVPVGHLQPWAPKAAVVPG